MIPIHALLSRIRWDPAFARGRWEIGYVDRMRAGLVRIPVSEMSRESAFGFDIVDEEGVAHSIPYHRVRQVWRDGKLFWVRTSTRPAKVVKPRPVRSRSAPEPRMRR